MVDSVTSFVIDKLVSLVSSEVQLLRGVHKESANIRDELKFIRAFLRDAETKKDTSEGLKEWVKQVREAAFLVEDVIDEYMLHLSQDDGDRNREVKGVFHRITSGAKRLKLRHDIKTSFQDVKAKLQEIKEKSQRYNLNRSESGEPSGINAAATVIRHDPRKGSIFVKESELVGVRSLKEELICQLVEGSSQRTVICMVGMGGVGKTTLCRKIFENDRVTAHFDFPVWITVSQSYTPEELLWSIIKQLMAARNESNQPELDKADRISLTMELQNKLRDTRYLVVFDDVWERDFWSDVEHALWENKRGSRVVITTRIKDVGYNCKKSSLVHVQEMNPLRDEDAWQLFCQKAFQFHSDGQCPEELKLLSKDIVKRCKGLPLAIVSVGGLLSTKEKIVSEWEKFKHKLVAALQSDPELESIIRILSLSYDDLPYILKACFLYLGMFPEDYLISRGRLIRLWVAEGFVNGEQGTLTPEEVADEYMMQLVSRCLIQVESVNFLGKPKLLRVHDWIREVILSKSDELSIRQVPPDLASNGTARRLSVFPGIKHTSSESITEYQTRSIMVFLSKSQKLSISIIPDRSFTPHFKEFKLLKVLDLGDFCFHSDVPKELGDLFRLGYLSLYVFRWSMIPTSIFKLCNLETLDLRDGGGEPQADVSQLSKLRRLKMKHCDRWMVGSKLKGGIERLEFLQTLYAVQADSVLGLIPGLESLKQLRKLGICELKREHGRALCTALDGLANLRWLCLSSEGMVDVIDLQSTPPLMLERLELRGRLEKLPEWLRRLRNLVVLKLYHSWLNEDPFSVLQTLPRLEQLDVYHESLVEVIAGGGFPKLKHLQVDFEIQPPEIMKAGGAIRGPHRVR